MIKIYLFSDTHKHFSQAIEEYEKRLGKEIEIIKLKPSKRKEEKEIIQEESQILKEKLSKEKGYKILLYITGKILSTESLFELIESKKQHFGDIIFVVGGAYGVDIFQIDNLIDYKLSFSPMTFPHAMAFMILLEQIYRVGMIKKGSGYHH